MNTPFSNAIDLIANATPIRRASRWRRPAGLSHAWRAGCVGLLAALAQVGALPAHAQPMSFPAIPMCGQCPPIADDPAKICDGSLRWGFNFDPSSRIPDQPGGALLGDLIRPVDHAFELWVFLGDAGLASPAACTPQTCLYQAIPKGSFQEVRAGRFLFEDPGAALGSARFVSKIDIRARPNAVHVGIDSLVATPANGRVSLVLTQIGNDIVTGGGVVTEPTVSLGIDRRHAPWQAAHCGLRLHDAGGSAPPIFCAPPLASECVQPPPTCAKRNCLAAAKIREAGTGRGVVELHVDVKPPAPMAIGSQPITVTLDRMNAPAVSVNVASLAAGELRRAGNRYRLRSRDLRVTVLARKDGTFVVDVVGKVALPSMGPYDDLVLTLSLGPATFAVPATPGLWTTDANGDLVVKAGAGGLPYCPR
jgi:hypothetical protein